jgi:serine protease Do
VLTALDTSAASAARQPGAPPARASNDVVGVTVEEIDSSTRSQLGLSAGEGVRVARITNPILQQSGLAVGDVILQVGKNPVGSARDFESALKGVKSGDHVRLLVRNNESTGLVTIPAS